MIMSDITVLIFACAMGLSYIAGYVIATFKQKEESDEQFVGYHRGYIFTDAEPPLEGPGNSSATSIMITSNVASGDKFPIKPSETMGARSSKNLENT